MFLSVMGGQWAGHLDRSVGSASCKKVIGKYHIVNKKKCHYKSNRMLQLFLTIVLNTGELISWT
jgi:hypothetical protein